MFGCASSYAPCHRVQKKLNVTIMVEEDVSQVETKIRQIEEEKRDEEGDEVDCQSVDLETIRSRIYPTSHNEA